MKGLLIGVCVCAVALPSQGVAESEDVLVGTWKLVSVSSRTDKGDINKGAHGTNPVGFLTYTSEGRVSVVIAEDGRKPLSVADRVSAPMEERAQAHSTFHAYAGRYTFTGDKVTLSQEMRKASAVSFNDSRRANGLRRAYRLWSV